MSKAILKGSITRGKNPVKVKPPAKQKRGLKTPKNDNSEETVAEEEKQNFIDSLNEPVLGDVLQMTPSQWLLGRRLLFKEELVKRTETFSELLPKHIPAIKFINIVLNACHNNPTLFQCSPVSIISSAMMSAQLGLFPDKNTGEAHLVPQQNKKKQNIFEAQFIPGYRGLIQLAMRTGTVKKFIARAVFQDDLFDYAFGTTEFVKHKPMGKSQQITHVYSVIEFTNGGVTFDVMTLEEVLAVRDNSPNYKETPAPQRKKTIWETNFPEMSKKTVIRRLAKFTPISTEFQTAVALDEKVEVLGETQIEADAIDFELLSPEEQEKHMKELIEKDRAKKEQFVKAETRGGQASTNRAGNLTRQTEELVTGVKQ